MDPNDDLEVNLKLDYNSQDALFFKGYGADGLLTSVLLEEG